MGLRIPDKEFWYNRNVFITGHTGFKGSWLSYLLTLMGANVYGYALQPNTKPSLFQLLRLSNDMFSFISDIRNQDELTDRLTGSKASVVFHMAAQPLVRESYNNPKYTFDTNIMGTVNMMEAIKQASTVEAVVVITTDKCYKNIDDDIPYSEDDPLGGYDPYSASKAAAEIVTSSYRDSFFNETNSTLIATARAGNVIGGGDWANDRLIPDIIRSIEANRDIIIRYPDAVRPWQHVLAPLSGYLLLAESMVNKGREYATAWNFGPELTDTKPVKWITERLVSCMETSSKIVIDLDHNPHESNVLTLNSSKAFNKLNWKGVWDIERSIESIADFYVRLKRNEPPRQILNDQIKSYFGAL